jgi:putative membrane protein
MQKLQLQDTLNTISQLLGNAKDIQNVLSAGLNNQMPDGTAVKNAVDASTNTAIASLNACSQTVENMKNVYTNSLVPGVNNILDNTTQILTNVTNLLNNLDRTLADMGNVFDGTKQTISATDDSFRQIQQVIKSVNSKLTDITTKLDAAGDDDKITALFTVLHGDPETYGEFFAEPVAVKTTQVYPISNYGSAVAPFYTTLALWVGGLVLVAIIKVRASVKGLENPKSYQLFFGRYLLFFVLGQIQALIIVLGNIYWLHCQVLHPIMFWFAASLTSFTFTLLIYALTLAFGDIGKAEAVVMVVIQIAGSGGTYPIEILPSFYQNVYIFFPFPYAINAMRETIGGMYGGTYEQSLAELLIFAVVALAIGLVIRIPFVGVNHFMEKRMKDTKMM